MSRRFKILLMLSVVLLQTTVLAHFKPLGVIPNYIFVAVIAVSVISSNAESVVICALTGLLTDMFTGAPLGLNTLLCMYLSIGCVIFAESIYTRSIKLVCPLGFVASFLYELLFGIISTLMRGVAFNIGLLSKIVLPVAGVNTIILIPVYIILRNVKSEKKRKGIKYEQ